MKNKKTVIFDLDGTLANIDVRRDKSLKPNGKLNWDIFAAPDSIMNWDKPNLPVIKMAQLFKADGFKIVIFSGRSDATFNATTDWLMKNQIMWHQLQMRPQDHLFMPDNDLKQMWLDTLIDKDDVFAVFDDRNQVVDMWRQNGLTCFQVADGDF